MELERNSNKTPSTPVMSAAENELNNIRKKHEHFFSLIRFHCPRIPTLTRV